MKFLIRHGELIATAILLAGCVYSVGFYLSVHAYGPALFAGFCVIGLAMALSDFASDVAHRRQVDLED